MAKRFVLVLAILAAAFGAFALGGEETPPPALRPAQAAAPASPVRTDKIQAEEARALLGGPVPPVLLDVRSPEDHRASHIPGAVLIPFEELASSAVSVLPVLDAPMLVYAESGERSAQALKTLESLGYTNARDLGAFASWAYETEQGSPNGGGAKEGTLSSFATWDIWGHPVDERIFQKADLTMINIWGTFCPPCVMEMPALGAISRERKDSGFQIVGIVLDAEPRKGIYSGMALQDARVIAEKTNASYTHLLPSPDLVKAKLKAVSVCPETIFVDREGRIVGGSCLGAKPRGDWERMIDELLAEARRRTKAPGETR